MKNPRLLFALALAGACSLGFTIGRIGADAEDAAAESPVSAELRALYEADQKARTGVDFGKLTPAEIDALASGDEQRRARVLELARAGALATAADQFHAAMVLQHGDDPSHFLLAHVLATAAAISGHDAGKWLSAAALDRYLQRSGAPQVFGTQFQRPGAAWTLEPLDAELLPDAVRAAFGVPALAEAKKRAAAMNQGG